MDRMYEMEGEINLGRREVKLRKDRTVLLDDLSDSGIKLWKTIPLGRPCVFVVVIIAIIVRECTFGWSKKMGSRRLVQTRAENQTNKSSEPSGTTTPSESRYSQNSLLNGRIIVDRILRRENLGNHEENWKERIYSGVSAGKSIGEELAVGIGPFTDVDVCDRFVVDYK